MTPEAVLSRLVFWQPKIFARLRNLSRTRCILSTAVGIDVLARFEIKAEARSVLATVSNAAWHRYWIEERGLGVRNPDPTPEEIAAQPKAAWSVWAGAAPGDGLDSVTETGWYGHLVIYVPAEGLMLDLDFQSFSRPEKSLATPGALALPWPLDQEAVSFEGRGAKGSVFVHYEKASDRGYLRAKDWQVRRPDLVEIIEYAIRQSDDGQ